MRVTHFVNDHRGGLARYVERLVEAQLAAQPPDVEPQVYGPSALRVPAGMRHLPYAFSPGRWGANQWKFAIQSLGVRDCGIRHFHNYTLGAIDVFTCHGLYTQNWLAKHGGGTARFDQKAQFKALSALERRCLNQAKVVVFQSQENEEFVADYFKLKRPGSFVKILQAVDTRQFHPSPSQDWLNQRQSVFPGIAAQSKWLLFVGHDFYGKGLLRILEALAARGPEASELSVLVFGHDPLNKPQAEAMAERTKVPVYFMEDDERLKIAFRCADFLMLDSVSEGGPMVLLEGMASGCVPIFTTCGGVRETIRQGVNGLVAKTAAHIVELALETSESERARMANGALETALERDVETFEKSYRAVYHAVRS